MHGALDLFAVARLSAALQRIIREFVPARLAKDKDRLFYYILFNGLGVHLLDGLNQTVYPFFNIPVMLLQIPVKVGEALDLYYILKAALK